MNQTNGGFDKTTPLPPHDAAANSWASARQRLLNARAAAAAATDELEAASKNEKEAWSRLEAESERGPQVSVSGGSTWVSAPQINGNVRYG